MTNPPAPARAQLIITITAEGKIEVTGPIHDKFVCYALLESAKDAVREYNDARAKSQIAIAAPGDVPNPSRDRNLQFDAPLRSS